MFTKVFKCISKLRRTPQTSEIGKLNFGKLNAEYNLRFGNFMFKFMVQFMTVDATVEIQKSILFKFKQIFCVCIRVFV